MYRTEYSGKGRVYGSQSVKDSLGTRLVVFVFLLSTLACTTLSLKQQRVFLPGGEHVHVHVP